jgi:8-oxo-dGTP pyrophosphatase MutT (NUDIX family)
MSTRILRQSAGVAVVRREGEGWRLLVLRCYRNWDFPKGGIEEGETPLEAAIRETEEESGIRDLQFHWGEAYCETGPYGRPPKVARYYLAETRQSGIELPISPSLGRPEHHEGRWVDLREAQRLLPPRLQPVLSWLTRNLKEDKNTQ